MDTKIGYDNVLTDSTLAATNTDAAYPIENIADYLPYDYWKAASAAGATISVSKTQACDYFAVSHHNLADVGAKLTLQKNAGAGWVTVDEYTFSTNKPFFSPFTSTTAGAWRVVVSSSVDVPQIGTMWLGAALALGSGPQQSGFIPPLSMKQDGSTSVSVGGAFLGASARAIAQAAVLSIRNTDPVWARANWLPFYEHAKTKPFMLAWDDVDHGDEIAFCWTDSKRLAPLRYQDPLYMQASLPLNYDISGAAGAAYAFMALASDLSIVGGSGSATFTRAAPNASYIDVADGPLKYATTNIPRFEAMADGGVGFLVEGAGDNLLTRSEQLDVAPWAAAGNAAVTADAAVAPDGTTTADNLYSTSAAAGTHQLNRPYTFSAAKYTSSIFAEDNGAQYVWGYVFDGVDTHRCIFDIVNGVVTEESAAAVAAVKDLGGGKYRLSITATTAAAAGAVWWGLMSSGTGGVTTSVPINDGAFLWGAKLELGGLTSYIPTTTAVVTRALDNCSIPNANIPPLVNGCTIVCKAALPNTGSLLAALAAWEGGKETAIYRHNTGAIRGHIGGVSLVSATTPDEGVHRYAIRTDGTTHDLLMDGAVIATNMGALSQPTIPLHIGSFSGSSSFLNDHIRELYIYPRPLTDAELV